MGVSNGEAPMENRMVVSQIIKKKKKKQLPYDIAIALLGLSKQQQRNLTAGTLTDIFTSIVITVLFTIARKLTQSKYRSPDKGINKCSLSIQWSVLQT